MVFYNTKNIDLSAIRRSLNTLHGNSSGKKKRKKKEKKKTKKTKTKV